MNINALLSPTESPARDESSSSSTSPPPKATRPAGPGSKSALRKEVSRSPDSGHSSPSSRPSTANDSPTRPQHAFRLPAFQLGAVPNFRPLQPPPTSHPTAHPTSAPEGSTWQGHVQHDHRPLVTQRTASTSHVEMAADLASTQRRHTSRALSASDIRQPPSPNAPRSSSLIDPTTSARPSLYHNNSGRSLVDLTMSEAAAQTPPPRVFESKAFSVAQSQRVTELLQYLNDNSYAYDSHIELINLLHRGFIEHASPPTDGSAQESADPHDYGLISELRQAREAMDTRFAVGEDIWDDWLSDEILLATTSEERINVTELFQKAVQDEPASVKLWQMYAGWVWFNYVACNAPSTPTSHGQNKWTDEDKALCKDLFTRNLVIEVLEQAIASTQWRVDESHVVWNRYAELVQEDFPSSPSPKEVERLRGMYVARLQFPHATWEETSQMFWSIVSKYEGNNWEAIMAEVQGVTGPAKTQMNQREPHESTLQRAIASGDKEAIFNQFSQYLQWEKNRERKQKHRSALDKELRCALYERALLRFPTYTDWWLDYVDFVISSGPSAPVLPLIERGTRHCPWSGELWARRILQSDVEGRPHEEIEATKHRATNSGLLDVGGMEEMVKVLQQWCSFLRRHAFKTSRNEDGVDTAEVGITMALEDIQQAGNKIYGNDFQGDPLFRVEQIQIKFLSEARRFDDARKIYQGLVKSQKNSYDFWAKYYNWELWIWGYDRINETHRVETADNGPDNATAVLQEALAQRDLDWPDKVLDMYLNHFQQHESGQRLRTALVEAREFAKQLANRRAAAAASEAAQQEPTSQQPVQTNIVRAAEIQPAQVNELTTVGEKRKRLSDIVPNGHSEKKSRTETEPETVSNEEAVPLEAAQDSSASASAQPKRDREHNTIALKNLPTDVEELDVKKFFRDVGAPLSISIVMDKNGETATATVEFETAEDVLAAKTRDGKDLKGNEVQIASGTQSTLYVANYPPDYDEPSIRNLFATFGEIVDVRLPSLKYNNKRRFCYVQFVTAGMAKAAEDAMDGKIFDGVHRLLAKISDPERKKPRSGAQAEGREVIVKNLNRDIPDEDVKSFFEKYGTVVSMNVVMLVSGKKTGTAFIVFSTAEQATQALEANQKPMQDRILHVELVSAKGRAPPLDRARKEDIIISHTTKSASHELPSIANGKRRDSDVSMTSNPQAAADDSWKTTRERKVAIFNLPDTVNDARVRTAMEEYGPLVKMQMRREDHGAIVEFANIKDAFNVRQGVDCTSLGPDAKTGDVAGLFAKTKSRPTDQKPAPPTVGGGEGGAMRPPPVVRPAQRGGKRGGLGFKRGGAFGAGRPTETSGPGDGVKKVAKSNSDFRNMFVKSMEDASKA